MHMVFHMKFFMFLKCLIVFPAIIGALWLILSLSTAVFSCR